jgi:quaternary ammonium compound-resistance protein SugE
MAWVALLAAGVLDVLWAVAMKYADGYTRIGWSIASLVLLAAFVLLLGRSLQVLPVGTAYAVWTGIGAVGTVLMGVVLFGEPLDPLAARLYCAGGSRHRRPQTASGVSRHRRGKKARA